MTCPEAVSVWLLARDDQQQELVRRVRELAPQHDGHVFEPHLTIQGDLALPDDAARALLRELAVATAVQHWPVRAVESTAHYFRSLFLRLDAGPAFDAMRRHCAERSGTEAGLSPYPHVSLAYGPARGDAPALRERLQREHAGQTLVFDRIVLARSGQAVAIEDWAVVAEEALRG
jgi:2'-5' RNA ligase